MTHKYLLEFDTYDADSDTVKTVYLSDGQGATVSGVSYLPYILDLGYVELSMFSGNDTSGVTSNSVGSCSLNNGNRSLDFLLDRGVDGRRILIKEKTGEAYTTVFEGIIESMVYSNQEITLNLKTKTHDFKDKKFQEITMTGAATIGVYDLSTISYDDYLDVTSVTSLNGTFSQVIFGNSGLKMYGVGFVGGTTYYIWQFTLSTAYDVSTATLDGTYALSFGVSCYIQMKPDGTSLFVLPFVGSGATIYKYTISSAWNLLSTVTSAGSYSLGSSSLVAFTLDSDGGGYTVFQSNSLYDRGFYYEMPTAWNVSTSVYVSPTGDVPLPVSSRDDSNHGNYGILDVSIVDSGTRAIITWFIYLNPSDTVPHRVIGQYSLNTAYDFSTLSFSGEYFIVQFDDIPWEYSSSLDRPNISSACANADMSEIYVFGTSYVGGGSTPYDIVAQYNLSQLTYTLNGAPEQAGELRPKIFGVVSNKEATLVDRSNDIYQLNTEPFTETAIYVGRAEITLDTVHTTLTSFTSQVVAGTIPSGQYSVYRGGYEYGVGTNDRGCFIALGTLPSKVVTFDGYEGWYNDYSFSNTFSSASWTKSQISLTENAISICNGEIPLNRLSETNTSGAHVLYRTVTREYNGKKGTVSFVAKAAERSKLRVAGNTSHIGSGNYVDFDLSAGTLTEYGNAVGTIEPLVDDAYRISVTFNCISNSVKIDTYILNDSGSLTYTGDSSKGLYLGCAQMEQYPTVSPYILNSSDTLNLSSSPHHILWKILNEKGYSISPLGLLCISNRAELGFTNGDSKISTKNEDIKIGDVVEYLSNTQKCYLLDTIGQSYDFGIGIFTLPSSDDTYITVDPSTILETPKIKFTGNREDILREVTVQYDENETVMSEADIFGTAELSDIPYISLQWRAATVSSTAATNKHLLSKPKTLDTLFRSLSNASSRALHELALYGDSRYIIEITLPKYYGENIDRNDVILVEDRLYKVISKRIRFASESDSSASNSIRFTAWGGIKV